MARKVGTSWSSATSLVIRTSGPEGGTLIVSGSSGSVVIASAAVRAVSGLGRRTAVAEDEGPVRGRLDLRRALRGLARDRASLHLVLDDGTVLVGTIDRVGADYVEVAEHAADLHRRA